MKISYLVLVSILTCSLNAFAGLGLPGATVCKGSNYGDSVELYVARDGEGAIEILELHVEGKPVDAFFRSLKQITTLSLADDFVMIRANRGANSISFIESFSGSLKVDEEPILVRYKNATFAMVCLED